MPASSILRTRSITAGVSAGNSIPDLLQLAEEQEKESGNFAE